jgi:hypothetical protein
MNKALSRIAVPAFLLIVLAAGCPIVPTDGDPVLQSIEITSMPTKTVYGRGESLDISGLVVTGTYSDGGKQEEAVGIDNITGYNPYIVDYQSLTVAINGKTASFQVRVETMPALQSITVTMLPAKTGYSTGELLDISGLVVIGTYSDGPTRREAVTLANITGYDAAVPGTQTLTITINGKTASFTVTVTDPVLVNIAITGIPAKTVYSRGESLDISGLVVTGFYSDGSFRAEAVTLANVSGYNAGSVGTQTLTVTINGKATSFTVTVKSGPVVTINLDDRPIPIDGMPEGIVLSRTGMENVLLTISGDYTGYAWYLNDNAAPVSTSAAYTLIIADCRLGTNTLAVEVEAPGRVWYSREITFTVNLNS